MAIVINECSECGKDPKLDAYPWSSGLTNSVMYSIHCKECQTKVNSVGNLMDMIDDWNGLNPINYTPKKWFRE